VGEACSMHGRSDNFGQKICIKEIIGRPRNRWDKNVKRDLK